MTIDYAKLVEAAKKNDEAAISELFQETYQSMYFMAKQTLRQEEEAEDIVQEAYIKAFKSLDMLREPEKFKPWLYKIVINKCKDYLKKKKPNLFTDMQVSQEDSELNYEDTLKNETIEYQPDDMLDRKAMVEIFNAIFEQLSPEQRLCMILYYREQKSVGEIAEILQISEGTVKSRLNYGRKKVKEEVERYEKEGIKLYSGMPILLWVLQRNGGEEITIPADMVSTILSAVGASGTATSIGTGGSVAGGTKVAVTSKVVTAASAGIKTKIIAGVVAGAVLVGGGVTVGNTIGQKNVTDNAYTAYETLLATEAAGDDLERNYYAYLDLNHDEIPELLLTDELRTIWTDYELYQYIHGKVVKSDYGSNYAGTFYLVNEDMLLTTSRGWGDTYTTATDDGIYKEAYNKTWQNLFGGQDNAMEGQDQEWYYYKAVGTDAGYENMHLTNMTEEEYLINSNSVDGKITHDGFVKTIKPIRFAENEFKTSKPDVVAQEDDLKKLLVMADRYRSNPKDTIVDETDYVFAAADYGGGIEVREGDLFSCVRRETVNSGTAMGYELAVYDKTDINGFFYDTVGLDSFIGLSEYTGKIDIDEDPWVYEKDGEVYILIEGLGGWWSDSAELIEYEENGDGTATAIFQRENYDGDTYYSKLIVQRNYDGGLQIVNYLRDVERQ